MTMREKAWFPIFYMFMVTLFFSAIIIIFGSFTRKRVEDNERVAFERAVLEALPVDMPAKISLSEIHRIYLDFVRDSIPETAGALRYMRDDSLIAYALPLEGPGFWAPIKGVIGISADKKTVTGIAFYEQNETPGLGGEIVKPSFRDQFIGKELSDRAFSLEIRLKTAELDESSVHAITGATQTSMRLSEFLNEQLRVWQEVIEEK
jgi:Na+-transporting NADH:ubiquinone oxidoreductase subunit C